MEHVTNINIAELCHMVNKAYCECMGDPSQKLWEHAPEWQKQSAINGVDFHMRYNNTTPMDSHASWYKEKKNNGWKYGPVKDEEKKEHPCMVTFEELPKDQQAKDYIFKSICDFFKQEQGE